MATNEKYPAGPLDDKQPAHLEVGGAGDRTLSQRLANPLEGIPRDQLIANVKAFCQEKGLTEYEDNMIKGAICAQNPNALEQLDVISDEERETLLYEKAHRWHQPKMLYATILLAAIGAATQGWDQTGSNGANLSFPVQFGINPVAGTPNYVQNEWLVGLVNAAPYIASAVLGAWLSDPLNQIGGRRFCIFVTAACLVATPIASGFTNTWPELFAVRFVLGIGMGAKGATVPVYAAENSPPAIRGALVMGWQLWTAAGIFIGFVANLVVANVGDIAWRLQLGSAFIPALPLMLFIYLMPESPRWLMKKNRYPQAMRSFRRLRFTELQACRDLYYAHVQLVEEFKAVSASNFFIRFKELFTIPRVRRATWASGTVMLAQQLCGINVIAFYSSTVFVASGFSDYQALCASVGFGALNWLFAIPALFMIDKFGRRNLLLSTFPNMAWTLLAAGMCFFIQQDQQDSKLRLGFVALFIYIFTIFYSVGEGPVPFAYSAEVFPLSHREVGMAWAVAVCLGFSSLLTITFPRILNAFTPQGAFGFYCGLNIVAFVMIFHLMPETKQLTLEELDQVFSIPHHKFVSYQYRKAVPYFIQRFVFLRKDVKLEPLYDFDDSLLSIGQSEYSQKNAFGVGAAAPHHQYEKEKTSQDGSSESNEQVKDAAGSSTA